MVNLVELGIDSIYLVSIIEQMGVKVTLVLNNFVRVFDDLVQLFVLVVELFFVADGYPTGVSFHLVSLALSSVSVGILGVLHGIGTCLTLQESRADVFVLFIDRLSHRSYFGLVSTIHDRVASLHFTLVLL